MRGEIRRKCVGMHMGSTRAVRLYIWMRYMYICVFISVDYCSQWQERDLERVF